MGMYENPFELSENSDNLTGLHCVMQRRIQDSISKNKRLRPTNLPIQRGRDLLNDENSNLYKKTEIKKEKLTISINTEDSTDISKSEHRNSVIKESSQSTNGINELIEEQAKLTEILKMEVQMSAIECGMDWSVIPQENVTVSLEENIHKQVQTLLVGQLQTTEPKICDKTTALDIVEVLVCENCNKPGHTKQYCHAKVCCKCKKEGHLSFNCPAAGKVCFKCNKGGHFSFNCPAAVKALPTPMPSVGQISAPTTTECTYCREKGHTSEDCPLTKYRRSTYTSLKHSLRACPKKNCQINSVSKDASVDHGKGNVPKVLENEEIKKARIIKDPKVLQNIIPKSVTPFITHTIPPPNEESKDCLVISPLRTDTSVDHGKRHSTEVSENGQVKKVKIPVEARLLQNVIQKEETHVTTQPVLPPIELTKVCFKCEKTGHSSKDCHICTKCRDAGHVVDECPNKVCRLCKQKGHLGFNCINKEAVCSNCAQTGHWGRECLETVCTKCQRKGHMPPDCPNTMCFTCTASVHSRRNCPSKVCIKCKKTDHESNNCPLEEKVCMKCKEVGHQGKDCPHDAEKVSCLLCNDPDHYFRDCPLILCSHCKQHDHGFSDCPNIKCLKTVKCKTNAPPTMRDCPNKVCYKSKKEGHTIINCPDAVEGSIPSVVQEAAICPASAGSASTAAADPVPTLVHKPVICPTPAESASSAPAESTSSAPTGPAPSVVQKAAIHPEHARIVPARIVCAICKQLGHFPIDCPNTRCTRTTCYHLVHTIRDCPKRGPAPSVIQKAVIHPEPARIVSARTVCVNCKKLGHFSIDCPNTRCTRTVVHNIRNCPKGACKRTSCVGLVHTVQDSPNKGPAFSVVQKAAIHPEHARIVSARAVCAICKQLGHFPIDCPNTRCTRTTCYHLVHTNRDCPKRACKRTSCEGLVHTIQACPNKDNGKITVKLPPTGAVKVCFKCGKSDHSSTDCTICNKCRDAGHFVDECPNKVCHLCKQKGHFGFNCFNKDAVCSNCAQTGHWLRECLETVCTECQQKGHFPIDCPSTICLTCTGLAHSRRNCPSKVLPTPAPSIARNDVPCPAKTNSPISAPTSRVNSVKQYSTKFFKEQQRKEMRIVVNQQVFQTLIQIQTTPLVTHPIPAPKEADKEILATKLTEVNDIKQCSGKDTDATGIQSSAEIIPTIAAIGIKMPPPKVRSVIDKTADFVARNGPEFEAKIHRKELANPKFIFFNTANPFYPYYQQKVKELRENRAGETIATSQSLLTPASIPSPLSTFSQITDEKELSPITTSPTTGSQKLPPTIPFKDVSQSPTSAALMAPAQVIYNTGYVQPPILPPSYSPSMPLPVIYSPSSCSSNLGQSANSQDLGQSFYSQNLGQCDYIENLGQSVCSQYLAESAYNKTAPSDHRVLVVVPLIDTVRVFSDPEPQQQPQYSQNLEQSPCSQNLTQSAYIGKALSNHGVLVADPLIDAVPDPQPQQQSQYSPNLGLCDYSQNLGQSACSQNLAQSAYSGKAPSNHGVLVADPLIDTVPDPQPQQQSQYSQDLGLCDYSQNLGQSACSQNLGQSVYCQNLAQSAYSEKSPSDHGVLVAVPLIDTVPEPQPQQTSQSQQTPQQLQQEPQQPLQEPHTSTSHDSNSTDTVYVCNLPTPCTTEMLRDLCQTAGEVTYVALMGCNTGVVRYEEISMAEEAVAVLDHIDFHNSTIIVGFFKNMERSL